jgi:hypothetical protein
MLAQAVRYILADRSADVPVNSGTDWSPDRLKIGKIEGKVALLRGVDLSGEGLRTLFVACDKGDRLYRCDLEKLEFQDVTAGHKLTSKSLAAAWGDFNRDGRIDLASWDGAALRVHLQADGGALPAGPALAAAKLGGEVIALSVVPGADGRTALLVSTKGVPQRVQLGKDGALTAAPLFPGGFAGGELGKAGACLVGDLDGDQVGDVLQPFERGSLLYKGKADGGFAAAAPCAVALGKGRSAACLGDWDANGLLDVFAVYAEGKRMWHNLGGGKFIETGLTGELAYIAKPGGVYAQVTDINNDGRQDLFIAYGGMYPHVFFNRGFRSFGHAHMLDAAQHNLFVEMDDAEGDDGMGMGGPMGGPMPGGPMGPGGGPGMPGSGEGQQAACIADLNDDGAHDMAVVLSSGNLWVLLRTVLDETALAASVVLPLGKGRSGPVTVVGYEKHRCLGAWNVLAGESEAFFGRRNPGRLTAKWRDPDGKPVEKEITLEDEPVRVTIK